MNRKLLFVVLSLAMLAGGVSVGIHVLHKQALANVTYTVEIFDEELTPVNDGTVWFSFNGGENWLVTVPIGDGRYEIPRDDYAGTWWIQLVDPAIEPPNPVEGQATVAFLHWDVVRDGP